jgi:hypothetical protein
MPSKPGKYDLKNLLGCESQTGYTLNGKIYCGREKELGKSVVLELCKPFYGSGRNVTTDNFPQPFPGMLSAGE